MKNSPPSLLEVQTWFFEKLKTFESQDSHGPQQKKDPHIDQWITSTRQFSSDDRLMVYCRSYIQRLQELLEGDYPVLSSILGPESFGQLAQEYFSTHPSQSPTLVEATYNFEDFFAVHSLAQQHPALKDLVSLETKMAKCQYAHQSESLSSIQRPKDLPFRIDTSLSLQRSQWPLLDIYKQEKLLEQNGQETFVAVYRREDDCKYRSLKEWEFLILQELQTGKDLSECFESLEAKALEVDPQEVEESFQRWVQWGFLKRL